MPNQPPASVRVLTPAATNKPLRAATGRNADRG